MSDNPLRRDPSKQTRKISTGGNYGEAAADYVGGFDDVWMDDTDLHILRRGDGVTPGGVVIGGGTTVIQQTADLSNYYTKTEVDALIPVIPSEPDLTPYATTDIVNALHAVNVARLDVLEPAVDANSARITVLENASGPDLSGYATISYVDSQEHFSGDYNDLTNKPVIPSSVPSATTLTINTASTFTLAQSDTSTHVNVNGFDFVDIIFDGTVPDPYFYLVDGINPGQRVSLYCNELSSITQPRIVGSHGNTGRWLAASTAVDMIWTGSKWSTFVDYT